MDLVIKMLFRVQVFFVNYILQNDNNILGRVYFICWFYCELLFFDDDFDGNDGGNCFVLLVVQLIRFEIFFLMLVCFLILLLLFCCFFLNFVSFYFRGQGVIFEKGGILICIKKRWDGILIDQFIVIVNNYCYVLYEL